MSNSIDQRYNTFFITLKIVNDLHVFTSQKYFKIILNSLDFCQKNKGMHILAYAILSNHLHLVFCIEENIVLSDLIRDFKRFTANSIIKNLKQDKKEILLNNFKEKADHRIDRNFKVWKKSVRPKSIYSEKFKQQKIDYVDYNAVHHCVVKDPVDYLYTSFHNHYRNIYKECNPVLELL